MVVLAGGRSRRLGRDKRFLAAGSRSLLERTLDVVRSLGSPIWLAVAAEQTAFLPRCPDVAVLHDPDPHAGPLCALDAILGRLDADVLLVAADLPDLDPAALATLTEAARANPGVAMVPRHDAGLEPLCAIYPRALAPQVREAVRDGERGLQAFLRGLAAEACQTLPLDARAFRNLNLPLDVEAWRSG